MSHRTKSPHLNKIGAGSGGSAVLSPNYGLYNDRPPLTVPKRGLQACRNVRTKNSSITNLNMGWDRFGKFAPLNGPLTLIDNFFDSALTQVLIFGTTKDLYKYVESTEKVLFITPTEATGTVSATNANPSVVTGAGTTWVTDEVKAGDEIAFGSATERDPDTAWHQIASVDGETQVTLSGPLFGDESANAHALTFNGNAQLSTAEKKFGSASLALDGLGDFVSSPDHADWLLSGAFTIHGWIRTVADATAKSILGQWNTTGDQRSFLLEVTSGKLLRASLSTDGTAGTVSTITGPAVTAAAWHHVALTRDAADNVRLFLNGTQVGATTVVSGALHDSTAALGIGSQHGGAAANGFNGNIDQVEIVKGTALWTANFTPPTAPQPITANHVFYWRCDGPNTYAGGAIPAGTAYTIRKLFTGSIEDWWDTTIFINDPVGDDLWFATNGVDDIVKFRTSDNEVTPLTALGFTSKTLLVFKNMLIYGYIIEDAGAVKPTSIINSDIGAPENVTTGLASEFIIHDGVDPVNALFVLSDNLVIYAERSITLAQFVGDPLVFAFRQSVAGVGPLAGRLVADYGDFHEFIGPDSQYDFDGISLNEIGFQVFRNVTRTRDPARSILGFSHFDEENGDLLWVIPLTTDPIPPGQTSPNIPPSTAFVAHYLEDVPRDVETPSTVRDFPFTASGFFQRQATLTWQDLAQTWETVNFTWNDQFLLAAFPFNLVGDFNGKVYTLNTNQLADGQPLVSFARFGRRPLGDGVMRGLLTRLYPFVKKLSGTLRVIVHLAEHASGPTTASEDMAFDTSLPEGGHFVTPYRRARYWEPEFRTSDGTGWTLDGYDFEVKVGGRR